MQRPRSTAGSRVPLQQRDGLLKSASVSSQPGSALPAEGAHPGLGGHRADDGPAGRAGPWACRAAAGQRGLPVQHMVIPGGHGYTSWTVFVLHLVLWPARSMLLRP